MELRTEELAMTFTSVEEKPLFTKPYLDLSLAHCGR
jgi:hypothetical protein